MGGRTAIRFIRNGSLTAQKYRDEILQPIIRRYVATICSKLIFMGNDNARPHRASAVEDLRKKVLNERTGLF